MDIYVNSSKEALAKCIEIMNSGKANLFRGQSHDWPTILPSLFRLSGEERQKADAELNYFINWAQSVIQMNPYHSSEKSLIAIAQHYGIPTNYLDLTTSPEIALLFSKINGELSPSSNKSVIYCFSESKLNKFKDGLLLRINVENLWRLEAQSGIFLEFLDETLVTKLKDFSIRIHFPSSKLKDAEHQLIYPQRRSHLETIIDQWFYRRTIESTTELFSEVAIKLGMHRDRSYPGTFLWREIPDIPINWIDEPIGWYHPPIESLSTSQNLTHIIISSINFDDLEKAIDNLTALFQDPIQNYYLTRQGLSLVVNIPEIGNAICKEISKILNRCWDGIRVLPYESSEMIICLARTATFVIGRTLKISEIDNLYEKLLGEYEFLEVAPLGGHIDIGAVSSKDLENAYSNKLYNHLAHWFHNEVTNNPRSLMKWTVEPWVLVDFTLFKRIYIKQLIPTSIDAYWKEQLIHDEISSDFWSTSFNPALLGYITNSDFKFKSPLALEPDPDHIVYITPSMSKTDIEESFVYCLLSILDQGDPYQVRFSDYDHDPRALWQIDRAIEQCQWIVEISGISVLEVITSHNNTQHPVSAGLGAFEVWLIANNLVEQWDKIDSSKAQQYYDEFYKLLLYSNADLEKRMANWINTSSS